MIYKQDLSQQEIADFYYLVDVFVMSSMFESFGKTAVEAMSRALLTASNKNRVDVVDWLTTHTAANASIKMKREKEIG